MVDGKAKLVREDFCDGLGNCLPVCPAGAITMEKREEEPKPLPCGCPGTNVQTIKGPEHNEKQADVHVSTEVLGTSELKQWPIQIKLVPVNAPYFNNAHLLIAADCAAYACGSFHRQFMKNKITLIGCPKLDDTDYKNKLYDIISGNNIKSLTVVRMQVPCCSGIEQAAVSALKDSGKFIPWQVFTLSTDGELC